MNKIETIALTAFLALCAAGVAGCGSSREQQIAAKNQTIAAESTAAESTRKVATAESLRVIRANEDSLNIILDTIYFEGDSFSVAQIPGLGNDVASKSIAEGIGPYGECTPGNYFRVDKGLIDYLSQNNGKNFTVPLRGYVDNQLLPSPDSSGGYAPRFNALDTTGWTPIGSRGSGSTFRKDLVATVSYEPISPIKGTDTLSGDDEVRGKLRITLSRPGDAKKSITHVLTFTEYGSLDSDSLSVRDDSTTDVYGIDQLINGPYQTQFGILQDELALVLGYLDHQRIKEEQLKLLGVENARADSVRQDSATTAARKSRLRL